MRTQNKPFLAGLSLLLSFLLCFVSLLPAFADDSSSESDGVIPSDTAWPKREDGTTPAGTESDPYLIEDAADLLAMNAKRASIASSYTEKTILLTADIDLNPGWTASSGTVPPNVWAEFYNFNGTLDGGGHTIRGIYRSGASYVGFFRNCNSCTIRNITFDNSLIEATTGQTSALFACLKGVCTFDRVTVGTDCIVRGVSSVGGLISCGYNGSELTTITNCIFLGTVSATGNYSGGLVGTTQGFPFVLSNCYTAGTVQTTGINAGGLIGNVGKEITLTDCVSTTTVSAADNAGCLIGRLAAKAHLTDCSAAGTVTATDHAAGLIGLSAGVVDLTRCVSSANLTSTNSKTASLLNETDTEPAKTLTDCYVFSTPAVAFRVGGEIQSNTSLQLTYEGQSASEIVVLDSPDALLQKPAYMPSGTYYGWKISGDVPMCAVIYDLLNGHSFESVDTEATCTECGYRIYTCSTCGYRYREVIAEMASHTSTGEWVYDLEPTETTGGKRHHVCSVCGTSYDYEYVPIEGAVYEATEEWGSEGVFEIGSPGDLIAFAAMRQTYSNYNGKRVILTADIDLNPGWNPSVGLPPTNILPYMFRFEGVFDGQDHTISGLYSTGDENGNYATFINILSNATVKNLKIVNSVFSGTGNYAGAFGTMVNTSTLDNIFVDADVSGKDYVGGICAWENKPSSGQSTVAVFRRCVFTGTVTGGKHVGGILGNNQSYELQMTDCANYGTVTANTECAAGLVGRVNGKSTLTRCYNGGTVSETGGKSAGLLVIAQIANTEEKPDNEKEILLQDCYLTSACSLPALKTIASGNGSKIQYGEESAETIGTKETLSTLLESFPSWILSADGTLAVPASLQCYVNGHNYQGTVTAPTCAEHGYTTYVCQTCGRVTLGDWVDPLPHTPSDEWIVDREPTETRAGSRHKICSVCGATLESEILPKLAPTETTADPTTEPADEEKKGCHCNTVSIAWILILPAVAILLPVQRKKQKHISK